MRKWILGLAAAAALPVVAGSVAGQDPPRGHRLEDHAWPEAEVLLRPDTVIVIPLGAAAKEHGRHLQLRNDLALADYFTRRVIEAADVVVAPTLTYHYYPAFVEYPGSTSLALDTARDLTVDVARSLARFGPRRFYVLNTGVSTVRALAPAAATLAAEGILLHYTDFAAHAEAASRGIRQQAGGTHADEVETSLALHIVPSAVDMTKAVREFNPSAGRATRLTRRGGGEGVYSESGVWGDPTLATAQKGAAIARTLTAAILGDIEKLRSAALPGRSPQREPTAAPRSAAQPPSGMPPDNCNPGELRRITRIGPAYTYYWATADAERLAGLWAATGDVFHPDGNIERGRDVIRSTRAELFGRREYRNSKHPLTLTYVRCITPDVAVADGRWNLVGVRDAGGRELPLFEGQATLVLHRAGDDWQIEAYRYTLKPPAQPMPVWLKRPGWPDK